MWKVEFNLWSRGKDFVKNRMSTKYPGKKTYNMGRIFGVVISAVLVVLILKAFFTDSNMDTSSYSDSSYEGNEEEQEQDFSNSNKTEEDACSVKGVNCGRRTSHANRRGKRRKIKLKLKAPQVIVRRDEATLKNLPTGSSFIGKLLTPVDTRATSNKLIRVLLPRGGAFNGKKLLPDKTVLLGQASYPNKGKRVYINFSLAVFPNGKEMSLEASALDSKDFSPGLIGRYHSAFKNRAVATTGLSFLAGFSETMQEREVLGGGAGPGVSIPVINKKATMKNAALSGLSEFSKTEGALHLDELRGRGPYVKIKANKPVIITLTQQLGKK